MSLKYIRQTYGVTEKRGGRIRFTDQNNGVWNGVIKSAKGARIRVLVDGRIPGYGGRLILHPTWTVEYLGV